jgi:uncharacterized membrane protein
LPLNALEDSMAHPTGTERLVRLVTGPVLLAAAVAALSGYAPLATGALNVLVGVVVLVFGAVLLVTGATTPPRPPTV